jgi:nitroimidazol reductase NimA-like FMN-containing flavoprotein (pyridoxamine 5'-phosphate oxidase superfamily)
MFKAMRRFKQQLSEEKCIEILTNEPHGVLSLISDSEYPYGFPITHWYDEKTGHIYFHGAKEGHKMDCLKRCNKASFCVIDKGFKKDSEWATHYHSVIVFGKIQIVDNSEKIKEICTELCLKFTNDQDYIDHELKYSGPSVQCFELIPEHISGKIVKES